MWPKRLEGRLSLRFGFERGFRGVACFKGAFGHDKAKGARIYAFGRPGGATPVVSAGRARCHVAMASGESDLRQTGLLFMPDSLGEALPTVSLLEAVSVRGVPYSHIRAYLWACPWIAAAVSTAFLRWVWLWGFAQRWAGLARARRLPGAQIAAPRAFERDGTLYIEDAGACPELFLGCLKSLGIVGRNG